LGGLLIVTVTADRWASKGPDRPLFSQDLRAEAVNALRCVDYVAVNGWPDASPAIARLRPHVFCKGIEYKDDPTPGLENELKAVEQVKGRLEFVGDLEYHSTRIWEELRAR